MVKINDPRKDRSGLAMRNLRAAVVYKCIKKNNFEKFDDTELELHNFDHEFYNHFVSSADAIKEELIYLWEELGYLHEDLDEEFKQNEEQNEDHDDTVFINVDDNSKPPAPKKLRIFGP